MWTVPVSDRAVGSWSYKGRTFNRRRVSVDWRRDNWCSPWVVLPVASQRSPLKPLWLDLMSPVWILMGADSCASMLSVDVSMKIGPVTRRDAPPLSLTAPPTPSPCFEIAENQRVRTPSLGRFLHASSPTCIGPALQGHRAAVFLAVVRRSALDVDGPSVAGVQCRDLVPSLDQDAAAVQVLPGAPPAPG